MQNGVDWCGAYLVGGYMGDVVGLDVSGLGRLGSGARSWF